MWEVYLYLRIVPAAGAETTSKITTPATQPAAQILLHTGPGNDANLVV